MKFALQNLRNASQIAKCEALIRIQDSNQSNQHNHIFIKLTRFKSSRSTMVKRVYLPSSESCGCSPGTGLILSRGFRNGI